ncbi:putative Nitrogen regulation protein NR(I) [Desulfamplus magnetovallimortis]|uniref:Putative Nitrogen regulation protein NR(I) n=1 Tax=Desulfamplus magnetovallimortis TaxID=1246637 RepID=A0A1W1HIU1_9BACT|nr:sigma-54 dependent transcriptional regulator [Desulfamplus magnetovallimortis]SLM32394.1 putative Nitrogen regulation protein NR(I) [Desulfamplus magnetovallimortis]
MEMTRSLNILIIDDSSPIQRLLTRNASRYKHICDCAGTLKEASSLLLEKQFDLIFLDIFLPDGNGIDFIHVFREQQQEIPLIVIITGSEDLNNIEDAMKKGAWDYLSKPFDSERLSQIFHRAVAVSLTSSEDLNNIEDAMKKGAWDYLSKPFDSERLSQIFHRAVAVSLTSKKTELIPILPSTIIGESQAIRKAIQTLFKAAPRDVNVLITGKSGTGKELFAHELHKKSPRADHPFMVVDCAVLPESLIESILFGHVKGAFTGAASDKVGLLVQAEKGTLFLDEIGELPMEVQKKFLRVLQERTFSPLGGKKIVPVNFRLVCATNRNLAEMVDAGKFRLDLYHRINTFPIHLPDIKYRQKDAVLLTHFFINKLCKKHKCQVRKLSDEFVEAIEIYDWPGNVRELRNVIEQMILTTSESTLYPDHLPGEIRAEVLKKNLSHKKGKPSSYTTDKVTGQLSSLTDSDIDDEFFSIMGKGEAIPTIKEIRQRAVEQTERNYLKAVLAHTNGNTSKAIAITGVAKSQFYRLIKKYDLKI